MPKINSSVLAWSKGEFTIQMVKWSIRKRERIHSIVCDTHCKTGCSVMPC